MNNYETFKEDPVFQNWALTVFIAQLHVNVLPFTHPSMILLFQ